MPYLDRSKWRVRVWVNGSKFSKTFPLGTAKKVADDYERKLKLSLIDPELSAQRKTDPTYAEFSNRWLNEFCKIHFSVSYFKKCNQVIVQHLNARFGKEKLASICSGDIVELQRELRKNEYAVQSINNVLAIASSIFKEAINEGLINTNPCSGVKRLKVGQRDEFQVWTLEERDRFLSLLHQRNFPFFQVCALALFTGLRPSELRGLLRDAIDFDRAQIRVHRQWCTKQNKLVPYTKTRQARTVPIPRPILQCLIDKRTEPGDAQLFPFLINSFGHRHLKKFMDEANVRIIRMHDFRHTFASQMLQNGSSLLEVKELLGHRKLESTAIYLHYMPDRNVGATDKILGELPWQNSGDNIRAIHG